MTPSAKTCPVCAGQQRYTVRRKVMVASWLGGHYEVTRATTIRCDACDGTGVIIRSEPLSPRSWNLLR